MANKQNKKTTPPDTSENNKQEGKNDSHATETNKTATENSDNLEGEKKTTPPDTSEASSSETDNQNKDLTEDVTHNVYGVDTEYKSHPIDHTTDTSRFVFIGDKGETDAFIEEHGPKDNADNVKETNTSEVFEEWKKRFNKTEDEPTSKNVAEIFNTNSNFEKAPNPGTRQRVPGYTIPPPPRGGWHKVIDPVTSKSSVITLEALNLLRENKTPIRYLGESDEKGKLLNK